MVAEWIVLTSSDRHILSVTESRLQSHNSALVSQSCEFFRDVLLQDFPTHIFIQRPNIVQVSNVCTRCARNVLTFDRSP